MRKIYADGLVRPDWATVDTANFQVDTQKGVTGVFVDTMDGSKRIWKYFEDNAIADVNDASKIATMTSVGPINGHTPCHHRLQRLLPHHQVRRQDRGGCQGLPALP